MTELTLQISVRLQDEGVPLGLAREVAQLFGRSDLNMFDAMEDALTLLIDHYAAEDRPSAVK